MPTLYSDFILRLRNHAHGLVHVADIAIADLNIPKPQSSAPDGFAHFNAVHQCLTVSLGVKNPDELDVSLSTLMQSVVEDEQPPSNAISGE